MTVPQPICTLVNPGDSTQRYILWGNGRIDGINAPPAGITGNTNLWYSRTDMPVGVAIWITNWTTGAGYVLDNQGGFQSLNGATTLGTGVYGTQDVTPLGVPYTLYPFRPYVDWSWDPNGSGRALVLDCYGQIYAYNGAAACPRTGPRWTFPAARKLQVQWTSGAPTKALTMDLYGGIHGDYNTVINSETEVYWPGWDAARDLIVNDWTTPTKGFILDLYGGVQVFGGQASAPGGPYRTNGDNARCLRVLNPSNPLRLWQVWSGGQQYEYNASTAPTVTAGAGVTEVQKVTITGTPTGGTFTLTFGGNTTAATAFNATASTVQTNLRALASIGGSNVTVTGGPGPGTPYTVTFAGALANTNVAQMTASSSFTGGASPTTTVTTIADGITASPANTVTATTTPTLSWAYSDAQADSQAQWQVYLYTQTYVTAHPGIDTNPDQFASGAVAYGSDTSSSVRGVVANVDLANGGYKYYVRVQDTSGLWSAWSSRTWTQSVTAPATPTNFTAVPDQANSRVVLSAACVPASATYVYFQYSDDGGATWHTVRGADLVPLVATTTATDYDPPMGATRLYRCYSYSLSPRVASATSGQAGTTITKQVYALTATSNPTLGGVIRPVDAPSFSRTQVSGVFTGLGAQYPVVVSDGVPKAQKLSLGLVCDNQATWLMLKGLVESNSTLVYRNPFGEVVYCRVVGDVTRTQINALPDVNEGFPIKHAHKVVIPLVEVATPTTTGALFTTPPGPAG